MIMKVVLNSFVKGVGKAGEVVEVADGYANNFLFARGLAQPASSKAVNALKKKQKEAQAKSQKLLASLKQAAQTINGQVYSVQAKTDEHGSLYAGITAKDVRKHLPAKVKKGELAQRMSIELKKPLKQLGDHTLKVSFGQGVNAQITLRIVAQ
jgi:large subunit ribosomal protein L9